VGIFEKSSRLRIARFSLGMFTPEARHSGSCSTNWLQTRASARGSSAPADYGKKIENPDWKTTLHSNPHPCVPGKPVAKPSDRPQASLDVTHAKRGPSDSRQNRVVGIAVRPASALDCAQLREASTTGDPVKDISVHRADIDQKISPAAARRHEWPVRTQCLTSAAHRLCPHPNSLALLSPIPKLASAATRHSSTDAQPDTQANH